jgi:outer membrane autotransporter protein
MNRPRTIRHILASYESASSRKPANDRVKRIIRGLPIATAAQASRSYISRLLRGGIMELVLFACLSFSTVVTHGQDATWAQNPANDLWNNSANWASVPPGLVPHTIAAFGASNITAITVTDMFDPTSVGTLQFNPGAPAYSFLIPSGNAFVLFGSGIVNLPSNTPTFIISGGEFIFQNGTAANSVITNNGGDLFFVGASTGGQAQFITNAGGRFDISDLSTGGMTAGSIAGAGTYNLGTNTLTVGGNGINGTVTGTIMGGGGALIKIGPETLTLSGMNTYSGGTTVSAGVLSVTNDSNLGATSGGLTLHGGELLTTGASFSSARPVTLSPLGNVNTLAAATGTTATYSGVFSGIGALTVGDFSHKGTVVLMNDANNYSGGTTVLSGGILSVNSDAVLGSASTGIILKSGGELLTTANFTSPRTVSLNPEEDNIVIATTLATSQPNILAAATNTTATYTGVVFGTGGLIVGDGTQAGTIVLSGTNTYTGGTVINSGTLLVDNAHALSTGNVTVNGGVLGADPEPINVLGNYTQNAGGTLQLQVNGINAGQFDSLNVSGNAALGGTLKLTTNGFAPQAGNQLTLVTAGGAISGKFAQFVDPFTIGSGISAIDLVYSRNSVLLQFLAATSPISPGVPVVPTTPGGPVVISTIDFASFAFTPNQVAGANLIDAVQLDARAANLISFLNTEPFANLPNDLQKISADGLTSFYEISFSNANIQKLTLEGRLDDIHNGSNGFSSNMNVNGATVNLYDRADADGKSLVEPVLQHTPENRWGVWMTGFGDFVNVDGDGNARGYNFTTGGVSLGIDYRLTEQLAIGVMGDYAHTWTSLKPGHIDVDSGRGGIYATWFNHGIYLNGAIYGGHNNYDSGRSGLDGLANGSTEGAEWSTFIGGGYDFHVGQLTVGPIASLQYTDVGIDSFSEKGSLAPLAIHSDSAESLRSDAGFRVFYPWQIAKIVVEPSLKAAWEHEYKYSALPITAGFAGIPGPSATFFGPSEGHDSAVVSAGVSVQVTPAITTYVNYDGQLGRGNYDSNAVTGGVRISF